MITEEQTLLDQIESIGELGEGVEIRKHPTVEIACCSNGLVYIYGSAKHPGHFTYGTLNSRGYRTTTLKGKNYLLHRLIAECFIPNPDNKPTVDHINRNPSDNRIENLRWATQKEQMENTSTVDNRVDYGVRKCDNKKEYVKAYNKAYREKNREQLKSYYKEYRSTHLEEIRAKDRARRRK
jgi:hypothetical protein